MAGRKQGKGAGAKRKVKDLSPKGRSKKVKGGALADRDGTRVAGRDVPRVAGGVNDALYPKVHDGLRP